MLTDGRTQMPFHNTSRFFKRAYKNYGRYMKLKTKNSLCVTVFSWYLMKFIMTKIKKVILIVNNLAYLIENKDIKMWFLTWFSAPVWYVNGFDLTYEMNTMFICEMFLANLEMENEIRAKSLRTLIIIHISSFIKIFEKEF